MLSIYNKDGTDEGAERVDEFLSTYLLRYHMSVPMKDFKNHATVNYEMDTFIRNHFPLNSFSVTYNMTFTKVKV